MKLGVVIDATFTRDRPSEVQFREKLELVRAARESGLHSFAMGEHYLADPHPWFQNIPFLARAAAEAHGLDVVGIVVLPLHHPVEIAEQVATLDIMTGGRFRLAVGLGWRDLEFQVFGVPREKRVRRYLEQIALIRKAWSGEEFTFDGEFFHVKEPSISTPPLQPGGPPIWMGASSEAMARRIGRRGESWIGSSHPTWEALETIADSYRDEFAKTGNSLPTERPGLRHCYVAADRATAIREAAPYVEVFYRQFGDWGLFRDVLKSGPDQPDLADVLRGRVVLGSPDDVAAELRRYSERFDYNHLLGYVGWPGMPHAQVRRAVELLGSEVLPRLNDGAGRPSAG